MDDYLWNLRGPPDPLVLRLELALLARRYRRPGRRGSLYWLLPLAAAALLLAGAALRAPSKDGPEPEPVAANPAVGPSQPLAAREREAPAAVTLEDEPASK